jgi:hypothetical protein
MNDTTPTAPKGERKRPVRNRLTLEEVAGLKATHAAELADLGRKLYFALMALPFAFGLGMLADRFL